MQDYIRKYCEIGWRVFPVEIYAKDDKIIKKPLIEGWIIKATKNYEEALELFKPYTNCQIGVATGIGSGITVVDIDIKGSKNGFTVLENTIELQPLLATPRQVTPTGGQHLFFQYTPELKNSVSLLDGVDVRNDGGFIVIAPSFFPDGRIYEWLIGQEPWESPLLVLPYELRQALKPKAKEVPGPSRVPEKIKSGERNDILFRQACSLREKGFAEDELFRTLKIFNETRCEKPVDDNELLQIAKSAAKFEQGEQKPKRKAKRLLYTLLQIMAADESTNKLFGYNEFTDDVEFMKSPPWNPLQPPLRIITDTDMISLKVYLSTKYAFEPPTGTIGEAIAYEAQNLKYHPVREFIRKLTWDGKSRLDHWLVVGAGCEDNVYIKAVGRKVLIGAVARVFDPGCIFQYMLVLEGEQGIGKSRLVSILGGAWFTELNITEEDKDVVEYMRGRWIIEVPEMVCARKTEVDHLKAFITKTKDRVRLAYRRNATDFPRQSILIGTINPSGDNTYLRDDTGGRRFWPVMCTNINIEWLKVNRDQLIAEAFEIYKHGQEDLHLTDPEVLAIAKRHQDERQQDDIWIQDIMSYILTGKQGFTIRDVAKEALHIDIGKIDRSAQIRIGLILKKMKIPSKRDGHENIRKYYPESVKKSEEEGMKGEW